MHKGLPTNLRLLFGENQPPGIIVLDDLQSEIENNLEVQQLFTKNAHHLNLTSIFNRSFHRKNMPPSCVFNFLS